MENPSDRLSLLPEQQDTAQLLNELLGKAVASRYEDFCRLSTGAFALKVSKPVAAHALRELDSVLRGILVVPLEAAILGGAEDTDRQKQARIALKQIGYDEKKIDDIVDKLEPRTEHKEQIRRILVRLGFEPDGDIAQLWTRVVDGYQVAHGRSFHQSLEIDEDFRTRILQPYDIVIREVVLALRSHYAALMRRVQALVAMQDRGRAAKLFAKEIPRAMQLQWHFFKNLTTEDWLEPLKQHRLLGEPPRFAEEEGNARMFREWPAGQYLHLMAGSENLHTRQRVITALRAVAESRHPDVISTGVAILAALPPTEAAPIVDIAVGWLSWNSRPLNAVAPIDLIKRLAEAGEQVAVLKVAREVFRLWDENGRIKGHFGDSMYEHYLPLLRAQLTAACGRGL